MIRRLAAPMGIAFLLSILVDRFFIPHGEAHGQFWLEIPGFFAAFGFAGCVLIVVASKALGHSWLQRDEDYYDR